MSIGREGGVGEESLDDGASLGAGCTNDEEGFGGHLEDGGVEVGSECNEELVDGSCLSEGWLVLTVSTSDIL